MKARALLGSLLRCCLLLVAAQQPLKAQEGREYPLGPIGGHYSVTANSSLALVRSVDAGGPGALAGLQTGDYIHGAFGKTFTPTGGSHYGVSQELGFAVDRAEAGDGVLPLLVIRPGTGGMAMNVGLPASGAFGPAYPRNSPKYAAMYENAVTQLHTSAMNGNGNLGYLTGFTGLCIIGHPSWNQTTGPKPYRLSVNKIRDFAINQINNWGYAPTESALVDGSAIPNPVGGPSNWELGQLVMFLSEYYVKTSDAAVVAPLQRGTEMCANTVQWWKQPVNGGLSPEYNQVAGMSSHGGVTGDYMHLGWYCGINMNGVHNLTGMAFARRAGVVDMSVRPKDGHYYGFTHLNPGDPIPDSIVNALPASITLPQYAADPVRGLTIANSSSNPVNRSDPSDPFWYNPSVNQKYLMQMNFICRRSLSGNGSIGYAPETGDTGEDGGRTPGGLLGLAMYRDDVGGLDAADLNRLELMKSRITNNYMNHQLAHVYLIGGQVFQALATPYLDDRQQRFFMDNWRFYFALARNTSNGPRYMQNRTHSDAGAYLSNDHCALINAALPYGIANGGYSLIPGYNTNRTLADFKSPALMWPTIAAHTCTVTSPSQAFQIDVCDGFGNVLAPANYSATWSHVSGPATATFTSNNTANTSISFPTVSATPYRVRLTVTRAGFPNLVEDIDVTRANVSAVIPAAITTHPLPQSTVPGGSASFSVTTSGTGPFVYQWRLNGVAHWGASPTPTLSLSNVGSGHLGSYDCVITTPEGTLVSNAATLSFDATLARIPGGLRREVWTGIGGVAMSDLSANANYPLFPSATGVVNSAEGPQGYGDNYGQRLRGWIKPPVTGSYRFYIASDDASQLWLSTDDTAANKVKVIDYLSTTSYRSYSSGGQSALINLVAGQNYYIEILHKEAGGGDHLNVAWQMPGEAVPANGSAPIEGVYLEYDQYLPLLTNHWKFDEASGGTGTDAAGGATATLFNNPARVAGVSGNAVSFNGTNQYAQATVNVSENVSAVSLWFRTTQSSGGLFSVVDGSSSFDRCVFLNGGNISSYIWSGETIISSGEDYADGQWHHVVHTFGGAIGGQKLYVDGVQVASGGKAQSDFNWQTAIKIGHAPNAGSPYFNGQIDDVRIYNAGLGVADAAAIHSVGLNAVPQMSAATFAVSESAAVGSSVGSMTASDANAGQTLAYSIEGGNVGGRFEINASSGAITVAAPLDYETAGGTYILTISVTDNGTPVQSVTATATINISNVNEGPVFAANPIIGQPAAPSIAYSGAVSATDPEGSAVTYSKINGPSWLSVASNGTLSGTPASGDTGLNSFTVRATDATSLSSDATLQIEVVNVAVNPVWTNTAGGSWPVAGNWLSNGVANGQGATANFATLNLGANATVTLDGARTIGGLKFGDTTPSHDWTLNTGSSGALTLAVPSGSPVISVANQNTTLNLVLAGNQGLVKSGAGTLTLGAVNTLTGTHAISQGTLAVSRHNAITATSLTLGNANTGSNSTGFKVLPGTSSAVPFSTINTSSFGTAHSITLDSGGSLGANAPALSCTLNLAGGVPLTINSANSGGHSTAQDWSGRITGTGIASGSTALVLDGTAWGLRLSFGNSSTPNTFTGDVLVQGYVTTQNQTYAGNTAGNQNIGFRFNNLRVAPNSTWNIVWGGETLGALNGTGNVGLNCQSALNNTGLTLGNTNTDGSFSGVISGGFGLAKVGSGIQTLGGANSYGGATSISGGTLLVNGSLAGGAVTVSSGAKLDGSGTVNGPVTLSSGATLAAGGSSSTGTLTLANTVALHDSGTVALRVEKSGGSASSDRIRLTGSSGLVYKGTLNVTLAAGSDALAAGDSFTLFSKSAGSFTGSFATTNLPSLPATMLWDTSRLATEGVIEVTSIPAVETPVFSLTPGSYIGAQTVSISSATAGATIRYTTDGSDPVSSGTAVSGATPAAVNFPAPANLTVRAYAFKAGMLDSAEASASYVTVAGTAVTWINASGGAWPTGGNWLQGVPASGSNVTALFDTVNLTADATVTLDGARTLGGLRFADSTASHNWTLNTGSGGPLTLSGLSDSPVVRVANQTATINAVLAGSQGLLKTGAGTLALGGTNTYSGTTTVSQGRLALMSNTALPATANLVIGDANSEVTAPNLYLGNQLAPTFATLTVGSGVAGAKLHTSGWAPTVSGITTLNSPLTIQQYNGGGVHTGLQNNGKITGPGAGAGNDSLIFSYSGGTNFYWQANNTAANDFAGNIRVTGSPGNMNAQGGSNGASNVVIPDAAMVTIDAGCAFRWNNFGNSAVVETIDGLAGAGDMSRNTSGGLISSLSLTINASNAANEGNRVFSGGLSSLDSFTFTGTGTQVFGGANSYTCPTAINGGTLVVNGSLANTTTTVAAAGALGGTGTIGGAVTNQGTLAPGFNGAGNLTIGNALTLTGGSKLAWEIANWTGAAGTGWDKVTVSSLSITASSGNPVVIRPVDLALANFSEAHASFVIVQTSGGISGFSADKFSVDTSGLSVPQGTWEVQQAGNNLVLAYSAYVPQANPDANGNGILDAWETANFGNANAGANPANGDADGDGLSNLMEYALGTNPLVASAGVLALVYDFETLGDGKHLRLTVPKNPAATNLSYIVESGGGLDDWSVLHTTVEVNGASQLIVRDNFTEVTAKQRFMRLRVEVVP